MARASHIDQPAPDDALQEALWLRTRTAARTLWRGMPQSLVLQCDDGRHAVIGRKRPATVVTGAPSELICWVYGRRSVAEVTVRDSWEVEIWPRVR